MKSVVHGYRLSCMQYGGHTHVELFSALLHSVRVISSVISSVMGKARCHCGIK